MVYNVVGKFLNKYLDMFYMIVLYKNVECIYYVY